MTYNLDSLSYIATRLYGGTPHAPDNTRGDENWTEEAECTQYPPDLFYPEQGGDTTPAKEICRDCIVRQRCLDDTMRREADAPSGRFGVAGGLSPDERSKLYRNGWRPGDNLPPVGVVRPRKGSRWAA